MFHAQNGWFFHRNGNGSVVIEHRVYGSEKNELNEPMYTIDVKELIPAGIWSSIVASVSAGGEEDGRFHVAQQFHNSAGRMLLLESEESPVK